MGTLIKPLRLLIVESTKYGAYLISSKLHKGGYDVLYQQVATATEMQHALCQRTWDLVVYNHELPDFNAIEAIKILQANGLDIPFIALFDQLEGTVAVEVMKAGAHDCLLKGHLDQLVTAVVRELQEAEIRQEKRQTEAAWLKFTAEELTEGRLFAMLSYEFLSVLNHELRTPLTSLQASIELLQTGRLGVLSEQGQYLLEIAARNTDRLVQLTNRMLEPGAFISTSSRSNTLVESVRDR